jgi:PAS domain S-box-containing protein
MSEVVMNLTKGDALSHRPIQPEFNTSVKLTQNELPQSVGAEERDRFFELSIDMLCIADTEGYFRLLNPAFKNILGYEIEELKSRPFFEFVHPDDLYATLNEIEKLRQGIPTSEFENRYRCKDGSYKWISWHCQPHPSGSLYAVARDITKEKEIQKSIHTSLREKEVLLKEIHHRVKNNLQVITSLINMQIRKIENVLAKDALLECQSRIQAIALIHEKLYQSTDYGRVTFAEYAQSLVHDIFRALNVSKKDISSEINIAHISISIDKAIPCALIMNELVTNSLKHAFPNEHKGKVNVSMEMVDSRNIQLRIQDNGVGIHENFDLKQSNSLGLQLVHTLAGQLNAKIFIDQAEGTCFTIQFPK